MVFFLLDLNLLVRCDLVSVDNNASDRASESALLQYRDGCSVSPAML